MSEIGDIIQEKCLSFGSRVIRMNDYLLEEACKRSEGGSLKSEVRRLKSEVRSLNSEDGIQTSSLIPQTSSLRPHSLRVPIYLQSVAALSNQLLRSGTSIGANNAEATNAISKADYKSKSYIALKEARESLYWIELLYRNAYLNDEQYRSMYADCEELVKIFVSRCKKIDEQLKNEKKKTQTSDFRPHD